MKAQDLQERDRNSKMCLHLAKNGCFLTPVLLKGQRQTNVSEEPLRRLALDAEVADDSAKSHFPSAELHFH